MQRAVAGHGRHRLVVATDEVVDHVNFGNRRTEGLIFEDAAFFGGNGDQSGRDVVLLGNQLSIVGFDQTAGLVLRYDGPSLTPIWDVRGAVQTSLQGITFQNDELWLVGNAMPPAWGSSDGAGDIEQKTAMARFSDEGVFLSARSENFFTYRGVEEYQAATTVGEGADAITYAAGFGEEMGWGGTRTILAAYDADGDLLWKRKYATDTDGNQIAGTYQGIGSQADDLVWLDGSLYIVGYDRHATQVGGSALRGMLLKYDAAGQPNDANPDADGAAILVPEWARVTDFQSRFLAVTGENGRIYAVGAVSGSGVPGGSNFLIQAYDTSGNLRWTTITGGNGADSLSGVACVDGRLFVVGRTNSLGAGGFDAILMEIDPSNGSVLSQDLFGGSEDDQAWAVVGEGSTLYVVGDTRSFTTNGNLVGQRDVMILRYSLALQPSITVTTVNLVESNEGVSLVIEDVVSEGKDDHLIISRNGSHVRIHDPYSPLTGGTGTIRVDENTIEVPLTAITGLILVDTLGGDDVLTVDFSGGNPIPAVGLAFDGGTGSDELVMAGGEFHTSSLTYVSASEGSIALDYDGSGSAVTTIAYTGLEMILSTIASDVVELIYTGGDETITISDAGGGQTTAVSTLGGLSTFTNPTESLRIVATSGTDTINIGALADSYASIEITNDDTTDVVNFNGPITFAADHDLTVLDVGTVNLPNRPARFASGSGAVSITALRNIVLASGSSITAVDGDIQPVRQPAGDPDGGNVYRNFA
jgi:hypothetical protein